MIYHLTGTIVHADTRFLVIDVGGVGYKVYTTAGVLEKPVRPGHPGGHLQETVSFWTYLAVREDALDLYGFPTKDELDMFELLLSVNGIGPKSALGVLNAANPATIRKAVATEDPSYLIKVSGVSKKNAEKIVLELKNKLIVVTEEEDAANTYGSDSLEALITLGYSERDSREALKRVPKNVTDTSESIRHALKILGKSK